MRLCVVLQAVAVRVKNLSWHTSRKQVLEHFSKYGEVERVHVMVNSYTGISNCQALVKLMHDSDVKKVLSEPKHVIDGRWVTVSEDIRESERMRPKKKAPDQSTTVQESVDEETTHSDTDSELLSSDSNHVDLEVETSAMENTPSTVHTQSEESVPK